MKKLLLISCFIFLLVCSAAFALQVKIEPFASDHNFHKETITFNGATINKYRSYYDYKATMHLDKGWNLVIGGTGFFDEHVLPGSELKMDDIEVVFGFFPASKKYIPLYPEPNEKQKKELIKIASTIKTEEKEEIKTTAKWIFAKRSGTLEMDFYLYYDVFALWKGWNLIALNTFLEDTSLSKHKGNCDILKVYEFKDNNWIEWDVNKLIDESDIGKGLAVKTSNDCVMFESENMMPPALPEE